VEQLIFVAIIVIFSILDSVARTKKKRQGGGPLPVPESPEQWEPEEESYDERPSYDDVEVRRAPEEAPQRPAPKGSEGMVPTDIWEEIAGLTRGRIPTPPAPKPIPTRPAPQPRFEVEAIPARPVETHRVHKAHAGFGTDPSARARSREDGLDPLARGLGIDAESARRQLLSRDRHALRQAVILQEILGPSAALREDPFER
jgi:hypothetical protein